MATTRMRIGGPLLAAALCGCAGSSKDDLTCGVGTANVDGVCVATSSLGCGDGTTEVDGECIATNVGPDCGEGTYEQDGLCLPNPDTDLDRGYYKRPLVWLQKQVGQGGALGPGGAGQTHMHVSEFVYREAASDRPAMLFSCSYTFSVLNANNPESMSYMAQGFFHYPTGYPATPLTGSKAPGCINLTLDDDNPDYAYVTHHGSITDGDAYITGWKLNARAPDPTRPSTIVLAPTQLQMLSELDGVSYEGLDYANGYIWVTLHDDGLGVFQRDPVTDVISRVATYKGALVNSWDVRVEGNIAYVVDGPAGLTILDVTDPFNITTLGQVNFDGIAHDLAVNGDTVYVAAQAGGLVVVDVTDKTAPVVRNVVGVPGSAIAIDYDDGQIYLAAWNDARVYDVSDPHDPQIIGGARLTVSKAYTGDGGDRPDITDRVLGIAGKGDVLFDGTWWTPNTFRIHKTRKAPYIYLPENLNFLTFPGDLTTGQSTTQTIEVRNDGTAPLTVFDIWFDNPTFTASPTQLRIDAGQSALVTLTFTAGATVQEEKTILSIESDDPAQPVRQGYLVGNLTGIGVGDPLPLTTATLLGQYSGQEWSSAEELGNVLLLGYWATF